MEVVTCGLKVCDFVLVLRDIQSVMLEGLLANFWMLDRRFFYTLCAHDKVDEALP